MKLFVRKERCSLTLEPLLPIVKDLFSTFLTSLIGIMSSFFDYFYASFIVYFCFSSMNVSPKILSFAIKYDFLLF